jgi:hypothetical protein
MSRICKCRKQDILTSFTFVERRIKMKVPMSDKPQEMKDLIEEGFPGTAQAIKDKKCPVCGLDITKFDDELSQREYEISGLCRECQDSIFGGE